jgi:hypothetical protein
VISADNGSASAEESTLVDSSPQFTLSQVDDPDPVQAGGLLTYTINYGNDSAANEIATNTVLRATYDPNVTFVVATPAPDAGTENQWTLGELLPGAGGSVVVQVEVGRGLHVADVSLAIPDELSDGAGGVGLDQIAPPQVHVPVAGTLLTNTVVIESDQGLAESEEVTTVEGSVGMDLAPPKPGVAGQPNQFDVIGATPGQQVYFVYGLRGGATAVPNCPGVAVEINKAKVFGKITADASGATTRTVKVPARMQGRELFFQAFDTATCRVTNLVNYQFQ